MFLSHALLPIVSLELSGMFIRDMHMQVLLLRRPCSIDPPQTSFTFEILKPPGTLVWKTPVGSYLAAASFILRMLSAP